MIDERTRAAVARLTTAEKECLRGRLAGRTAKEMAIELRISPHAVEKRLKMARAKLGLSSSLDAARLVEAAARTGPQPAGLAETGAGGAATSSARRWALAGAMPMILAIFLAALCQASAPVPPVPARAPAATTAENAIFDQHGKIVPARRVDTAEATRFAAQAFDAKDTDRSGFLDPAEASALEPRDRFRDAELPPAPPIGDTDPAAARKWMAKLDSDRDGRVSRAEYIAYMLPWTLWEGVPANWRGAEAAAAAAH